MTFRFKGGDAYEVDYSLLRHLTLNPKEKAMPEIMTTNEVAGYLALHPITICKYAAEGAIPAKRIGRVWRFEKDILDRWIAEGQNIPSIGKGAKRKAAKK